MRDVNFKLDNCEPVVKEESIVDVKQDFIEIPSVEVGTNVKPSEETKLKKRVRHRRPRSSRKRIRKLQNKGIDDNIAKKLADMTPDKMLEFVKHDVGDLNKVKSFLKDVNRRKLRLQEKIKKKIIAKQNRKAKAKTMKPVFFPGFRNCIAMNSHLSDIRKPQGRQREFIINIKDEINSLDNRQMNIIRCCLIKDIVLMEKSKRPKIIDWSFNNDYIEVKCANIQSMLWLMRHVNQLKPWPNAILSAYVNNPNININKGRIGRFSKASKVDTAILSPQSISDDKEVLKSEFIPLTNVHESEDIKLSQYIKEASNVENTSNTVDNPNNTCMLDVIKFEVKNENSASITTDSLTFGDITYGDMSFVNKFVTNSKTNITATKNPHRDENTVKSAIVWETNIEDLTLIDNYTKSVINPISVLKTSTATNTGNFSNNITVVHEKLSGSQKRKRRRAIKAMETEVMNKRGNKFYKYNVPVLSNETNIIKEDKNTGDVIVISDDDFPVSKGKTNDVCKASKNTQDQKEIKKKGNKNKFEELRQRYENFRRTCGLE